MQLTGYADKFSVKPGETIKFYVSSKQPKYKAELVRVIHGDPNPKGPGFKTESVPTDIDGEYHGYEQVLYGGSHVIVDDAASFNIENSFTITSWIYPTMPDSGKSQAIVTKLSKEGTKGYGFFINKRGELALWAGDGNSSDCVTSGRKLRKSNWYFVAASFDQPSQTLKIYQKPMGWTQGSERTLSDKIIDFSRIHFTEDPLYIAASIDSNGKHRKGFNGKIEQPTIYKDILSIDDIDNLSMDAGQISEENTVASWDFSIGMSTQIATDIGPNGLNGKVVNLPLRAAIGHNWTGENYVAEKSPGEYGAIHFHEDDIDDAGWDESITWNVPTDFRSGIYALKTISGEKNDHIPVFVRPLLGKPQSKIGFLLETNTYLAYGNEHVLDANEVMPTDLVPNWNQDINRDELDYLKENNLHSMYDFKVDGSGVAYQSRKIPILNIRPDFITPSRGGPHCLTADLIIADWLEEKGHEFDVFTSEDLEFDGKKLLEQYNVIILGTHPEYWTLKMLKAMSSYLANGGRMMYLGGNGLYWVTSFDPERPHVVEIRRWGGTEIWKAEPGEYYHSTTGELGGIWRKRGWPPQKIAGVGFAAQGFDIGTAYELQEDSNDSRVDFIFKGVNRDDELIGDHPSLMLNHGAAGDEVDRLDFGLGTPPHALLLATSAGRHTKAYHHVIEEMFTTDSSQHGEVNEFVRSDVVFFETPKGGAVFSTGSINWCGVLSYDEYNNDISVITDNVVTRFASDEPLPPIPG